MSHNITAYDSIVLASQTAGHHNLTENKLAAEPSLVLNFQSCLPWFSSSTVWAFTPMPPLALTQAVVTKMKIVAWAAASSKALALVANRIKVLRVKRENYQFLSNKQEIKDACILFLRLALHVQLKLILFWRFPHPSLYVRLVLGPHISQLLHLLLHPGLASMLD